MLISMLLISCVSTILIQKIFKQFEIASERSQIQRLNVINKLFDIIVGQEIKLFNKENILVRDFISENGKLNKLIKKL